MLPSFTWPKSISLDLRNKIEQLTFTSSDLKNLHVGTLLRLCLYSEKVSKRIMSISSQGLAELFLKDAEVTSQLFYTAFFSKPIEQFIKTYKFEAVHLHPNTMLKQHQLNTIKWMKDCESSSFIGIKGGIVALQQGLGKTLCAVFHSLSSTKIDGYPTLLVCDQSLLNNWQQDIDKFFPDVKYLVFHSNYLKKSNIPSVEKIKTYDFVITTYGMCKTAFQADDYKLRCLDYGPEDTLFSSKILGYKNSKRADCDITKAIGMACLYHIPWTRIILDEAQKINNYSTEVFKTVLSLYGEYKWCLSGTPIRNNITDLWSLLKFCGYTGTNHPKEFSLKKYDSELLSSRIFRMNYDDAGIKLPEKTQQTIVVQLTQEEKDCYDFFHSKAKKLSFQVEQGKNKYGALLAAFTKLRQICIAPYIMLSCAKLKPQNKVDSFMSKLPENMQTWLNDVDGTAGIKSSKIQAIKDTIKKIPENQKIILFSKFVSSLLLMERAIKEDEILPSDTVHVIHGNLNETQRNESLMKFQQDSNARLLMITYDVGSTGLNIVEATHCILMDTWWNSIVLEQAQSRIHRIGQTNNVIVYKFLTDKTIEMKMEDICTKKNEITHQFLDSASTAKKRSVGGVKLTKKTIKNFLNS